MVERFEVGKSYRWIGPTKPTEWCIPAELSLIWEKGGPHRLNRKEGVNNYRFTGIHTKKYGGFWSYNGMESNFEEVTNEAD